MKSTHLTIIVLLLIVAGAAVYTYYIRSSATDDTGIGTSEVAAALDTQIYTTLTGEPLDLSRYIGEGVVVINSWASWCPFCVNELPDFAALAEEYKSQGVTVIAINRKEDARTAGNFIKTLDNLNDIIFALDPEDAFYDVIGGFTMPETIFYATNGSIAVHKRGFMTLEEMRLHTETALTSSN